MSTVKIKTEPTTTATTPAAVDVKVKLEPSLSAVDIKHEQYTSDIDTKIESDSEADSDIKSECDDDIKSEFDNENDENYEDTGQNQAAKAPKNIQKFICECNGCGRILKTAYDLRMHRHEHKLQTELIVLGESYNLTRQSLNDLWPCPIPNCEMASTTAGALYTHIRIRHRNIIGKQQNQQQPPVKKTQLKYYFVDVDNFYVDGVRCRYHNTIGVFICYECRLVPECLLTHLQQKHGCNEKSIDNSSLPESAVIATADPNINQHISNPHLVAAISQPYQQQHPDVVQGWLCTTSDCGHCGYSSTNKRDHKRKIHQNEQLVTVPALVLRLVYAKAQSSYFLITRIDHASSAVSTSSNKVNQRQLGDGNSGSNTRDEKEDDADQNKTINAPNQKRQWKCEYPNCERFFSSADQLIGHRREHRLEVVIKVHGRTIVLTRQCSDDRWSCPVLDCETTCKTVNGIHGHIRSVHSVSMTQKRTNDEDGNNEQKQIIKRTQRTIQYLNVDDFYVWGARFGYHITTGLFMCHECRLVPECLLAHLQQKHEFGEKSIDNAILPESVRMAGSVNPNVNQHTSNLNLASTNNEPAQQQHPDIVKGWLCNKPNCDYCCSTRASIYQHHFREHRGEQITTVPAFVLRLIYTKTQTSYVLITRLDAISSSVEPNNSMSQNNSECDDEDDGDELVLSDYSDEDDIHESETVTLSAEPPSTQPKPHSQSQSSQYSMFNMPLPDDPEFWRLVNNS